MDILTVNGGSSSIKFAVYNIAEIPERKMHGNIERIGLKGTVLTFASGDNGHIVKEAANISSPEEAALFFISWLDNRQEASFINAVGHRIVHGLDHSHAEIISEKLLNELQQISNYDPDHLPMELGLVKAFQEKHPEWKQVACFDTAFHTTIPRVASLLPIPRRFEKAGIRRYGFHGLSYAYLLEELVRMGEDAASTGRMILAHLGNGASITAVRNGKSIDTSMGFTPAGGLVMGTRPGDIDPGVAWYLMQKDSLTNDQFNDLINHQSGLLGISETSSDMRDLLKSEQDDIRAAEAVSLFCYQVKKWIGSYAAVLGGLDVLVFTGGIGENAGQVRERICEDLAFFGITIDENANKNNQKIISSSGSNVKVYVIPANEELMIAKITHRTLSD